MTVNMEEVTQKVNRLSALAQNAENKKILWEEIKILSDTAFKLQDEIMELLQELEETQTDLTKIQSVFDTREWVWNLMSKITAREMEIKEKATKNHQNAHEKHPVTHTDKCHHGGKCNASKSDTCTCCDHEHESCHHEGKHHHQKCTCDNTQETAKTKK
ncbi:MAG: hypothetical protein ACI4QM_03075 [Alphaproteobacteria bacterium]